MRFVDTQPPKPKDDSLYNQTEPTECTVEELKEWRKAPKYTLTQKIIQIILFIIFGPVKIVCAVVFGFIAGSFFVAACALWRAVGRPVSWKPPLRGLWSKTARVFLFILGFHRINVHGERDPSARFLVANHTCFFDGWLFLPWEPRPLGKKEVLHMPVLREVAELYDGIAVDRSKGTGVSKLLTENAMDNTKPPVSILPEGASTSGDYMLRFHLGAFLSDLPVQPATIKYTYYGTNRDISHISFFHHYASQMIAFLGIPSLKIDITFLEPMSIKEFGDDDPARKFADAVSLRIANKLGVKLINLSSNSIYKKEEQKKKD